MNEDTKIESKAKIRTLNIMKLTVKDFTMTSIPQVIRVYKESVLEELIKQGIHKKCEVVVFLFKNYIKYHKEGVCLNDYEHY